MTPETGSYGSTSPQREPTAAGRVLEGRGVWCLDASTNTAITLALAGFDWICVDMQHGHYDQAALTDVARGLGGRGAPLVVRVPSVEFTAIGLALDVGAAAVIVPQIDTAEQAAQAVAATFYPPKGRRSFGQLAPSWGAAPADPEEANGRTACVVMIESASALANVDAIAAVPGVDMLFIGPFDLTLSLGSSIDIELADGSDGSAISRILRAAEAHAVSVGAFGANPTRARRFNERGIACTGWATDQWIMSQGVAAAFA
jgi:4-hydroxy-2-oxoheptanedioate aldolase